MPLRQFALEPENGFGPGLGIGDARPLQYPFDIRHIGGAMADEGFAVLEVVITAWQPQAGLLDRQDIPAGLAPVDHGRRAKQGGMAHPAHAARQFAAVLGFQDAIQFAPQHLDTALVATLGIEIAPVQIGYMLFRGARRQGFAEQLPEQAFQLLLGA